MPKRPPENLHEILRGLIGSGFSGNQQKMCEVLEEHGVFVNQSTVSRALRRLGAVKLSGPDAPGPDASSYELRPQKSPPDFGGGMASLVQSFDHNGMLIILRTTPGSAMFVAGFIDRTCSEHALGTVAGDDTIFIAPPSAGTIDQDMAAIRKTIAEI